MDKLTRIDGKAYPFGQKNIDTDVIIASKWLKTITRDGLGKGAFESIRGDGDSVFDDPAYVGSPILIAGDNFGCGSSREHAAWAIGDMGIRAIMAPSYSDIFSGNAVKNGILPVVLPQAAIDRLMEVAAEGSPITVDLETQTVTTQYQDRFAFDIDPFRKHCLLNGLDEVALTMERGEAIGGFESQRAASKGWLMAGTNA
ncbi:MAG: 3-isopropylmalate dehydratase small subunit [Pseudomonadota bacterium]